MEPWDEENCYIKFKRGGKSIVLSALFDEEMFDYSMKEVQTPREESACESSPRPSATRLSAKTSPEDSLEADWWVKVKEKFGGDPELLSELMAKLSHIPDVAGQAETTIVSAQEHKTLVAAVPTSWAAPTSAPNAEDQSNIDSLASEG